MTPNNTIFQPIAAGAKKVAYTGTAGNTAAIAANASAVWIVVTTDAFVKVGATAVADQDLYLPAYTPIVLSCAGGDVISAVQVSAGGTLYATPLA